MVDSRVLSDPERRLLEELVARRVRFLVVGMSAALLQGARGSTEDIDLWFADVSDPAIAASVRAAGGIWISGSFGMGPPRIGGEVLGDRFDVVTTMSGLPDFDTEFLGAIREVVDGVELPVLPLRRILESKRAAGRPKDLAAIPAIEDALAVIERLESR